MIDLRLGSNSSSLVPGSWTKLWSLQVPSKIKHFLWKACRGCLPIKEAFQEHGVSIPLSCVMCSINIEDCWHHLWHCPPLDFLKCNVDTAVNLNGMAVGLGMVLRNGKGQLITAKEIACASSMQVNEAEAYGLLQAVIWARQMRFKRVIFESDAKTVVDAVNHSQLDFSEFGSIILSSRRFWQWSRITRSAMLRGKLT
ncbi:hypothetical protein PTKIN_Ptkin10aG0034300 [Pterospermum kingtungense]